MRGESGSGGGVGLGRKRFSDAASDAPAHNTRGVRTHYVAIADKNVANSELGEKRARKKATAREKKRARRGEREKGCGGGGGWGGKRGGETERAPISCASSACACCRGGVLAAAPLLAGASRSASTTTRVVPRSAATSRAMLCSRLITCIQRHRATERQKDIEDFLVSIHSGGNKCGACAAHLSKLLV